MKVLLDTDIGSDIDDAVCLAYLLLQPSCELLGITTVTGESDRRAMIASAICTAASRRIPIFPGAQEPLIFPQKQNTAPQAAAIHKWDHAEDFPRGEAVAFMRETIRENPGEITLLTIGPLTNIALLFKVDPAIPDMLEGMVSMCGRFTDQVKGPYGPMEWNASGDPHASAIVYRSMLRRHRTLPLDVTSWVSLGAADFRSMAGGVKVFAPVLDFAEIWFTGRSGTTFHDPLAAATIFSENLCSFRKGEVEVELADQSALGATRWTDNPGEGRHEVAFEVKPDLFFEHFRSVISSEGA